ncbi:FtsK/SpoIIIE family DNA translocase [Thermospira aquatica]|uniref:DNA translocase FtsK 4TM domain-containing protein n=1 Tax=Thermospira aquatica TaxID=2828656 RepID=A0AAX3BFK1_9SPIR|nr:DNA translocase FtsK 4TM domain-containing protein [Thermospira aquatica]URA11152.1 DNA translocase FtsK 4TM domain-containing protein [Thermospira aquatica]
MRVVIGYLCLGISAFLLLAVLSFHPGDTILLVSQPNQLVENIAGKAGAWASSYLVIIYGYPSAILLSFGLLVVGLHVLAKSKLGQIWLKVLLFFIAALSLSTFCAFVVPQPDYRWGGLVGIAIAQTMSEVAPPFVGAGIFLVSFLWSLIASLRFLQRLFALIGGGIIEILFSAPKKQAELEKAISPKKGENLFPDEAEEGPGEVLPEFFPREEAESTREEPAFLRRSVTESEEGMHASDANIEVPFWLVDSNASFSLKKELARACGIEEEESFVSSGEESEDRDKHEDSILSGEEKSFSHPGYEEFFGEESFETGGEPAEIKSEETIEPEEKLEPSENHKDTADLFTDEKSSLEEPLKASHKEYLSLRDDQPVRRTSTYMMPSTSLLEIDLRERFGPEDEKEVKSVANLIEMTFKSFKIDVQVVGYSRGPAITRYEVQIPSGLKLRSITSLVEDLGLNLGFSDIRIVAPIGEKGLVGIEVPNRKRRHVLLREVVESSEFEKSEAILPLILGKDITGNILVEDLVEMPHLLIAGTTGSGKSVYVNAFLASLLFKKSYDELKFLLIDPKMVELELYNGLPHLLAPVITQPEVAIVVLEWVVKEMERRYKLFSELGVRNLKEYHEVCPPEKGFERLYYLVVVIDEFADLMLRIPKETERVISRLAAMARAVGIHLVVATQRPSVDVVTGIIKANFPSRVAFRVSSQTDSRTILDRGGAEKLLGKGDMLFMCPKNTDLVRLQAPYVSGKEIETLVYEIKRQKKVEYLLDVEKLMEEVENPSLSSGERGPRDPLFEEALRLAAETGEVSASFLQRKLRIGYNRASRIVDMMDSMRILGPSTGTSKPRTVLISPDEVSEYLEME